MRFSKVLLIYPQYKVYDPFIPIGIGYIAQALSDANIDYDFIDMSLGYSNSMLKSKIKEFKPDLIGISMMTLSYEKVYNFINHLKQIVPLAKIVVGGPHVSTLRERALEECQDIDYAVVLAGEEAIVELCTNKALKDIKGLIYREGKKSIFNGFRPISADLDTYSFPRYNKFEIKKYWFREDVPMPIVSSRGCPYRCTFCISRPSGGDKFHTRSANNVVDEIEYWYQQGRIVFDFMDDNFTLDKERVYLICEQIQKRSLQKLEYRLTNGIRADKIDRKLLERMKKVGFTSLSFGVESASDKILEIIKKGETIAQIEEGIKNACELGYKVDLYFLVGSPYETQADLNASFAFALSYPIHQALFFNIIPIPNTELYEWIKEKHLFVYPPQRYLNTSQIIDKRPVFQTAELPLRERQKALLLAKSVSKKTKIRYYQEILSDYRIFTNLLSIVAASDFVHKRLMYIPVIKRTLRFAKRRLIPNKHKIINDLLLRGKKQFLNKKILLVTEQFPPLVGGGIVYFYNIFKNFSSNEVVVYTTRRKGAAEFDRRQKLRIIRGWIWKGPLSLFHISSLIGPIYLCIALSRCVLKEKVDIIHCGTVQPFAAYGLFFKKLFGIPYIVHTFGEEIMMLQRNGFKKKLISWFLNKANKVIVISEFMKDQLIRLGVKEQDIAIVPMCVDTNIFLPKDCPDLKEKLNLQDKRVILTIARLVERKGHDVVIKSLPEILEKLPNLVYLIVGSGPNEDKLKNLVKDLGLEKQVIFIAELPHEAVVDYYNICDLFIMPNRELKDTGEIEGFGVVFLEANACSKPVIGGRSAGAPEAIIDGSTGILIDQVTDPDEVSRAILSLLLDKEASRRMGEVGRKRVQDYFNWNTMAKKLEELDRKLLNERRQYHARPEAGLG